MNIYHKKCLLCNSDNLKMLKKYISAHLCKCNECKFIFSKKIPSSNDLIKYYDGYGRSDYLSDVTIKRYNHLLDKFEKYRKTNKLIDIGCGIGYFLEVAKKRGWDVYGTEFTEEAVQICETKGIKMKMGYLNPSNYIKDEFDIVTSFEVLEHINNPREEIENFKKILRTGGLVYLTTPNFNSILRYKLQNNYDVINYPEHLSYYTNRTLNYLFEMSEFKKIKIQATGISLTKLKTKKGKVSEGAIKEDSTDEILRHKIEENNFLQFIKNTLNTILSILRLGDSLKGWFVKL